MTKKLTLEQQRAIYCVKHGHSRLRDFFFGYHSCCRCGQQLGDSLGGVYSDSTAVYVHHMHLHTHKPEEAARMQGCECPKNAKALRPGDFKLVPAWNSFGYEQRPPWREKEVK